MPQQNAVRNVASYLWKAPLCALTYVVGTMLGAPLAMSLGVVMPTLPFRVDPGTMTAATFLASLVLAFGIGPLAKQLQGGFWTRWLILAAFTYTAAGINSAIEGSVFTTLVRADSMSVLLFLPLVLFSAAAALLFRPQERGQPFPLNATGFFAGRTPAEWAWRFPVAWLAFPVIYFAFGMCVGPFVAAHYRQGEFWLVLPPVGVIAVVQLLRSLLFLLGTLPVLIAWPGTRRQLVPALGLALFVLVGASGLVQGYWLPASLRLTHTPEVFDDSFVHAAALTLLLRK